MWSSFWLLGEIIYTGTKILNISYFINKYLRVKIVVTYEIKKGTLGGIKNGLK